MSRELVCEMAACCPMETAGWAELLEPALLVAGGSFLLAGIAFFVSRRDQRNKSVQDALSALTSPDVVRARDVVGRAAYSKKRSSHSEPSTGSPKYGLGAKVVNALSAEPSAPVEEVSSEYVSADQLRHAAFEVMWAIQLAAVHLEQGNAGHTRERVELAFHHIELMAAALNAKSFRERINAEEFQQTVNKTNERLESLSSGRFLIWGSPVTQ